LEFGVALKLQREEEGGLAQRIGEMIDPQA
jgi:hypothetical protein